MPRYPDNPPGHVGDDRHPIARGARHLLIDEIVLQLLAATHPSWTETVARTTVTHQKGLGAGIRPHRGRESVFGHLPSRLGTIQHLGRNGRPDFPNLGLSWNRQAI